MEIKYLVGWAGGKNRLIPEISNRLPSDFGSTINTYVEPFVGGGSVMFHILQHYPIQHVYVNDKNDCLINVYKAIKECPSELYDTIEALDDSYCSKNVDEKKVMYYELRQ